MLTPSYKFRKYHQAVILQYLQWKSHSNDILQICTYDNIIKEAPGSVRSFHCSLSCWWKRLDIYTKIHPFSCVYCYVSPNDTCVLP